MGRSGMPSGGGGGFGGGFSGGGRRSGGFSGGGRGGRSGGFGGFGGFGGRSASRMPGGMGYGYPGRPGMGGAFWGGMLGGSIFGRRNRPVIINNYPSSPQGGQPLYGGPAPQGAAPQQQGGSSSLGCMGWAMIFIVLALMLSLLSGGLSSCSGDGGVAASTVERKALPASAVQQTAYYTDVDGSWVGSAGQLERGMQRFQELTGVQPYVYILPNGQTNSTQQLSEFSDKAYQKLFRDEAHFLLVFCDDGYGSFNCGYTVGSQAKSIMDNEAVGILRDYLDRYYRDYNISEEEIFSKSFADTAERIMTVTPSPFEVLALPLLVVGVGCVIAFVVKRRSDDRRRQQEHTERVLNTPLEKFSDSKLDDLEQKYESASGEGISSAPDADTAAAAYEDGPVADHGEADDRPVDGNT